MVGWPWWDGCGNKWRLANSRGDASGQLQALRSCLHRPPPAPPPLQVKECLRLAARGEVYGGGDAATDGAAGGQQHAGAGAGGGGEGGDAEKAHGAEGGSERGQRQEQQLHEDEEVLRAQLEADGAAAAAADGGTDGIGQAAADALLDEGRLLGEKVLDADRQQRGKRGGSGGAELAATRGTVKRLRLGDEADDPSLGLSRLGLAGVLMWVGALVGAFFLLPWAKRAGRASRAFMPTGASPYRKGGRDD